MLLSVSSDVSASGSSGAPDPERLLRRLTAAMLSAVGLLVVFTVTAQTSPFESPVVVDDPSSERSTSSEDAAPSASRRVLFERASHPSTALDPYLDLSAGTATARLPTVLREFHDLLNQYVIRQSRDDNFTVRVLDRRTDEVLEVYQLADRRAEYLQERSTAWADVDRQRRRVMNRLVEKYEERGVPLEDIVVRWGRANQVTAAHERDRPYNAYERQLAEYLGLSLLATEIGTVETFNQDTRLSAAGARSRYQMLPWILRRSGVNEYTLPTEAESWIRVREEHHPLLVLEPAFLLLRGYVNAVGHELPGLSAYHTGPGNIFKLYRTFYTHSGRLATASSVADAYAWAVTDGFETVSDGSTFGGDSRGYVPALYGSLAARDSQSVPPEPTFRAARLQVRPDTILTLKEILTPLASAQHALDWGHAAEEASVYERFRTLNPHFDLPSSAADGVPTAGNVRLVSSVDGKAVRFFLPLRAPSVLRSAGVTGLDSTATFRYNASTYAGPSRYQVTRWDRAYEALVEDIQAFGFTHRNRERLFALHERFEALAERRPTRYRRRQLKIIGTHRRLWRSNPWEELADATKEALGQRPVSPRPPHPQDSSEWDVGDLELRGLPLSEPR